MASYEISLRLLLSPGHEFGSSPQDVDRGWVVFGITQKTLRELGYHREAADRRLITPSFINQFYLKEFWLPNRLGDLAHQEIADMLLGMLVNAPSIAKRRFQLAIADLGGHLTIDGIIGPATIAAANLLPPLDLYLRFQSRMKDHYDHLAATNPAKYGGYRTGWLNRLYSFPQPPSSHKG